MGLTKWGDLKSKLKAFDLGVDDIMSTPFSPRGTPRQSDCHHASNDG